MPRYEFCLSTCLGLDYLLAMFKSKYILASSKYPNLPSFKTFHRYWSTIICVVLFQFSIITFHSCGLDVEDPIPPSPPVWVQKSLPEEWPERGIDAYESGGIFLEWESSIEEDIIAYNIYRATWYEVNDSLGEFDLLRRLERDLTSRQYLDLNTEARIRYYYRLRAEDASNNLSDYSDSLSYKILPSITTEWQAPNGLNSILPIDRHLQWLYLWSVEMENYCITVLSENQKLIARHIFVPGNYIGNFESWQIPDSVVLDYGKIYHWRIDTGAKYIGGNETTGSESAWATFLYAGP
jgi:hypothetical protein